MLSIIKNVNLGLAFLLELCLLGALGYWGFTTPWGKLAHFGLGIGVPLLVAIIWGSFEAPMAKWPLPEPWHLLLKLALFGLGVIALFAASRWQTGIVFAAVVIINIILAYAWGQEIHH